MSLISSCAEIDGRGCTAREEGEKREKPIPNKWGKSKINKE